MIWQMSLFITILSLVLITSVSLLINKKRIINASYIDKLYKNIDYEIIMYSTLVFICVFICSFIFFNKVFVSCVISIIGIPIFIKKVIGLVKVKRNKLLEKQFCEILQIMASFLVAGRSPELIFIDVVNEFDNINGQYALIIKEFKLINRQLSFNYTIEEALEAFARRSQNKDIQSFASAYTICQLSGGNLVELVRNTSLVLRVKLETEDEIKLLLTLPKFNHKILTIMPFVLLGLLRVSSPEYIAPLYNSTTGILIMFIVASIMVIAWFLGEGISNIKL